MMGGIKRRPGAFGDGQELAELGTTIIECRKGKSYSCSGEDGGASRVRG